MYFLVARAFPLLLLNFIQFSGYKVGQAFGFLSKRLSLLQYGHFRLYRGVQKSFSVKKECVGRGGAVSSRLGPLFADIYYCFLRFFLSDGGGNRSMRDMKSKWECLFTYRIMVI